MDNEKKYIRHLRIPRATNLLLLKKILNHLNDQNDLEDIYKSLKFESMIYLNEYILLLDMLRCIKKKNSSISLTNKGMEIKSKIDDKDKLTDNDKKIFRRDFLNLYPVKLFIKNVFNNHTLNEFIKNDICLTKEEIERKYQLYRKVNEITVSRESRIIYNWLLDLDVLESLKFIDFKKNDYKVCYHPIGREMDIKLFSKEIKIWFSKFSIRHEKKSDWFEIPTIRNHFCMQYNISKKQFDELFIDYIKTNPSVFQLSTGSSIRTEVEKEGIKINDKILFYVRLMWRI